MKKWCMRNHASFFVGKWKEKGSHLPKAHKNQTKIKAKTASALANNDICFCMLDKRLYNCEIHF